MRRSVVLVAGLAMVAASGCGASSDEDEARDVVRQYAEAIADGDEGKVCDTLSKDSKNGFDRAKTTCEDAYKNFGRFLSGKQKDELKNVDPEVKVNGDRATAKVAEPPLEGALRLKREDGEWKISTQ
jgi:hypothetical protein